MKIGVVANRTKTGAAALLPRLRTACEAGGIKPIFESRTAQLIGERGPGLAALIKKIDLLLVAGGDGSLLQVVSELYPAPVPLLGINIGSLGFLTAITREEVAEVMPYVLQGHLRYSPRQVLEAVVYSGKKKHHIPCALNDFVIFRGNSSRLVRMRVRLDGVLVNEYVADGLIVATPTGSTAYGMAAGGPIISPETKAFTLNPICPHSLSNRGLVFSTESVLTIEVPAGAPPVTLQFDGQPCDRLQAGDSVEIKAAAAPVVLAFLADRDFFQILRQKLKWSGASV